MLVTISNNGKGSVELIEVTNDEAWEADDKLGGFCLACGDYSEGDCEPDATKYPCHLCGSREVYGFANLVIMGKVSIISDSTKDL